MSYQSEKQKYLSHISAFWYTSISPDVMKEHSNLQVHGIDEVRICSDRENSSNSVSEYEANPEYDSKKKEGSLLNKLSFICKSLYDN